MLDGLDAQFVGARLDSGANSIALLGQVAADDLDRIVDTRWTPAVTLGVRLVSVINDSMQHVGQAAFVRGCLERA